VYEGCGRLQLCPLSPPQQRDLIRLALGGPAAPRPQVEALLEYVLRLPPTWHTGGFELLALAYTVVRLLGGLGMRRLFRGGLRPG